MIGVIISALVLIGVLKAVSDEEIGFFTAAILALVTSVVTNFLSIGLSIGLAILLGPLPGVILGVLLGATIAAVALGFVVGYMFGLDNKSAMIVGGAYMLVNVILGIGATLLFSTAR